RLGLAIALLSDPEFIILDEPTNGLDPMGIVEMRELLKKLNREKGLTVLISSHILSELYQLVTKFGIIHQGQLLEEISAGELNDRYDKYVSIKIDEHTIGVIVLEEKLFAHDFEILSVGTIKLYSYLDDVHLVSRTLTEHVLVIEHLTQNDDSLENY